MIKLYTKCKRSCAVATAVVMAASSLWAENVDFTQFIKNNSFESNFDYWTQAEMKVQSNSTFPLKQGNNYVEKWVSASSGGAGNCSVSQDLTDIVPGKYTLTVAAQNHLEGNGENQTGVWIYAGSVQTAVGAVNEYTVDFEVGTDGKVTVGYKAVNASGNYLAVDNFRLTLTELNTAGVATFIDNTCSAAETVLTAKMTASVAEEVRTAMAALRAAGQTDAVAISNAVAALRKAIDKAQASADAYAKLNTAVANLETAYAKVSNRPDAVETRALLDSAIEMYNNATATTAEVNTMVAKLEKTLTATNAIIKAFADLQISIDKLQVEYDKIQGKPGSESVAQVLAEARQMIEQATATAAEAIAMKKRVDSAILLYNISQSTGNPPTVTTTPYIARGSTLALGRSKVVPTNVLESGFCWSTSPNPTVADNRTTKKFSNKGTIFHIEGLEPSTVYYMRAYAISRDYAVGYGDVVKVITLPKGTATWTYDYTGDDATNERIVEATASAVDYWNNCTTIHNWNASVHYNAGVPTADCSYGGWIRVGANSSYQRTGTLLHEMNHGVGVGQHAVWYGPNSPYRADGTRGYWLGQRATKLVQFLENSTTAQLNGDNTHMWPYGVNGAHEDNGSEILYLANSLITQAVGEDGLPPVANEFHSPCYYFPSEDSVKYYLKVEDAASNSNTNYLVEGEGNTVKWETMNGETALANDNAAWYITFNPVTCYYTFRNVATGNTLVTSKTTTQVKTKATPTSVDISSFQLTGSIKPVTVGSKELYTYWISGGYKASAPRSLALNNAGSVTTTTFSTGTLSKLQRWHIFSEEEMSTFDTAAGSFSVECDESMFPADIYDIAGRIVKRNATGTDGLSSGFYIVGGQKVFVQ